MRSERDFKPQPNDRRRRPRDALGRPMMATALETPPPPDTDEGDEGEDGDEGLQAKRASVSPP